MRRFFIKVQNAIALREQHEDRGATMVEYGLMVTLVAVFMVASVTVFRGAIATAFTNAANAL